MKSFFEIFYGKLKNPAQKLDVYLPECESFPVFIYFHGGGIEGGDKGAHPYMYEDLTNQGICVVSANYRMYPEAKYPEYLEDAAEAVKWVFDNIGRYGKANKIIVSGTSAGGYISQMLCFDKRWLEEVGLSNADISGYLHDAGQPTTHFNVLRERGLDHRRVIVDEAAPLYYIGLEKSYPRMRFLVSDNDMPARYEQIMLVIKTLKYFEYPETYDYKVMHGKHCHYTCHADENGYSVWGNMVLDFIKERN